MENAPNPWQEYFDAEAKRAQEHQTVRDTIAEVDFLLEELRPPDGGSVLDVGCGTGRHAVELARRGYRVTGVDLSAAMLDKARQNVEAAGVHVELIQADATQFRMAGDCDAAICLYEAGFGLLAESDDPIEHDRRILRNIHASLKPGGGLLLTAPNGLAKIRKLSHEDARTRVFDPVRLVETYEVQCDTPQGRRSLRVRQRGYVPTELVMMFHALGLRVENLWGGTPGKWNRQPVDPDEPEIMIVARRAQ